MTAYYNENDSFCAQWLRNCIAAGHIALGDVDDRDIRDVKPRDLAGYNQCHFFAGIGGWSRALRLAGVGAHIPLWTGSCPCQPFSQAGARRGFADERHLWPDWFHLVSVCRPAIILGEQVAHGGLPWLDLVLSDLEGEGYACGAAVLPAASVGTPHERQRIWFAAFANSEGQHDVPLYAEVAETPELASNAICTKLRQQPGWRSGANGSGATLIERSSKKRNAPDTNEQPMGRITEPRAERNFWFVEPDVGRVADGVPARVDKLRAYGNAIVPQVAAEFIKAIMP